MQNGWLRLVHPYGNTDNCRTIKRKKQEPITRQLLYLILFVTEIRPPVYLALQPTSLSFQELIKLTELDVDVLQSHTPTRWIGYIKGKSVQPVAPSTPGVACNWVWVARCSSFLAIILAGCTLVSARRSQMQLILAEQGKERRAFVWLLY